MYRHTNTETNSSQSSDHDSTSTRSSERRQRQIPLAFTNTEWGREYASNPKRSHENLEFARQGSRFRPEPAQLNRPTPLREVSNLAHDAYISATSPPVSSAATSSTTSPTTIQSATQYSTMTAWSYFSHTLPPRTRSISPRVTDSESTETPSPVRKEIITAGPWFEMLMRWEDFKHWRLGMLSQPCFR
ncbi:hypothetical protein E4T38_07126 [Aureobasidium subglaciale]|nr:hypothetical protein E4T38_07126 [Aureobasidium subglaciale]KAI5217936.1 hypothetical protein E4T40_07181 [Aureobasidium subglaciale]KAI5221405.1 hypothetical protein E4T41_07101 [Aureobasidium subglaciale]KAI5259034.1 hypothetical protein E4T46_07034 [Aureobasidium subglaciale]